jgi:hypothetical protein
MVNTGITLSLLGLIVWIRLRSPDGWVPILDDANLVFHEAGHPLVGLVSQNLMVYGGTLGQLVFPILTSFHFWRRKEPYSFALCLAWFFENLLNIARYMADARTQVLPFVGGGEHDWTEIFSRWHVLAYDLGIAHTLAAVGWMGIVGTGLWLFLSQRRSS